ncbi:conserved Plasmodium protein, unknown function [Plasmodium gallinaceum]|uniref:Uncharacterized protein n=1 Tax=Plasmodium gallinaceum TaxID=5849 RepID=A0A1J1GLG1_PLAGA|nr:conserved Plasmodium protein, unknown function [Plasmodium gallinaceum]CRG93163.1 conserved Plasmodium protein, unknown function [Plasmodium gallinaceum]
MAEKKIDDSPFLSKMETFEISDKKNKKSKNDIKDGYKNLENEFNFDEEKVENNEQEKEKINKDNDKKEVNIRTIKIDRKNLKKMFSSQFFTQTLTDDSSSDTANVSKLNKKYFICEFFKRFFIILLFFITSFYAIFYIYNNYFNRKHICGNLDLYNYKYDNEVRFVPSISNTKYYVFTGKFPFDVITYKLRKDVLKNSMNEELKKYKREDQTEIYEQIENLDDHQIQILSFTKYNSKMKCEKKILDLYTPFYLKTTDANIKNYDYVLSEVNYNFITNPYNIPEKKLYMELLNFVKKNENQNKICFITSYLKSLKEDDNLSNRMLNENNFTNEYSMDEKSNNIDDPNKFMNDPSNNKRYLKNRSSSEEQGPSSYQENNFSSNNNDNNFSSNNNGNGNNFSSNNNSNGNNFSSNNNSNGNNFSNNNNGNGNNFNSTIYNNNKVSPKKKIIFLYDSYDNNLVNLIIAIYNMQYGNIYNNLKEYWEELKKNFRIINAEEIYLFEWYCLAINYNIIENNNQFKLNCVDLLK